jgi:hypothetical protein
MDTTFLKEVLAQGGAMAIAALLVYFYRKDLLTQRDFSRDTIDRLLKVVNDNTQAMESLKTHLERVNVCPVFERNIEDAMAMRRARVEARQDARQDIRQDARQDLRTDQRTQHTT